MNYMCLYIGLSFALFSYVRSQNFTVNDTLLDDPVDAKSSSCESMNCHLGTCLLNSKRQPYCYCNETYTGNNCQFKKAPCERLKINIDSDTEIEHEQELRKQFKPDKLPGSLSYDNPNCKIQDRKIFKIKKTFGFILARFHVKICGGGSSNVSLDLYNKALTAGEFPSSDAQVTTYRPEDVKKCVMKHVPGYDLSFVVNHLVTEDDYRFEIILGTDIGGLKAGAIAAICFVGVFAIFIILLILLTQRARNMPMY